MPITSCKLLVQQRRIRHLWGDPCDGEYISSVDTAIHCAKCHCSINIEKSFNGWYIFADFESFENAIEERLRESDRTAQACLSEIKRAYIVINGWEQLYNIKDDPNEDISSRTQWLICIIEKFNQSINDKFEDWNYGRPLGEMSQQTKEIVIKHPESTSPTIMSMLTTQSNEEAEQIVGRIKDIISTNIASKNIAIILVALEQMGYISLSNISLLSRVWYAEFGYRATQKSLENGLSNHISGDHTRFERDNKNDIEQRKKQLQCNIVGNI